MLRSAKICVDDKDKRADHPCTIVQCINQNGLYSIIVFTLPSSPRPARFGTALHDKQCSVNRTELCWCGTINSPKLASAQAVLPEYK